MTDPAKVADLIAKLNTRWREVVTGFYGEEPVGPEMFDAAVTAYGYLGAIMMESSYGYIGRAKIDRAIDHAVAERANHDGQSD
jgi:hypothetical protein